MGPHRIFVIWLSDLEELTVGLFWSSDKMDNPDLLQGTLKCPSSMERKSIIILHVYQSKDHMCDFNSNCSNLSFVDPVWEHLNVFSSTSSSIGGSQGKARLQFRRSSGYRAHFPAYRYNGCCGQPQFRTWMPDPVSYERSPRRSNVESLWWKFFLILLGTGCNQECSHGFFPNERKIRY